MQSLKHLISAAGLAMLAALSSGCLSLATAQSDIKIGFVHNEKLLRESPAALKVARKIDADFQKRRADVKGMSDRIAEIQKQIDKNGLTMPDAERRVKDREIAALSRDFQRMQRELQEDLDLRTNEELRNLADRANKILRRIAEAEKFDLIVQQEAVVYISPRIDLTDRIIKEMGE